MCHVNHKPEERHFTQEVSHPAGGPTSLHPLDSWGTWSHLQHEAARFLLVILTNGRGTGSSEQVEPVSAPTSSTFSSAAVLPPAPSPASTCPPCSDWQLILAKASAQEGATIFLGVSVPSSQACVMACCEGSCRCIQDLPRTCYSSQQPLTAITIVYHHLLLQGTRA